MQDDKGDSRFGRKYIGVRANGRLEIHGEEKTPWTRLSQTLKPYEPLDSLNLSPTSGHVNGITLVEFDRATGKLVGTKTVNTKEQLTVELNTLKAKDEFLVFIQNRFQVTNPSRTMSNEDCPSRLCINDCDESRWNIPF